MEEISLQAYAKINLGLDVLRKREDGYHEVRMVMQSISLADTLTLRKCPGDGIRLRLIGAGTDAEGLPLDESNLIYKAILLLKEEFRISEGIEAQLTKEIPIAAGMAGGSTDAAAALKAMNQLFSLGLSEEQLRIRGVSLGADVPYCLMGGTALAEGIGEILTPLPPMPDCLILIAKPPVAVSTAFVYGNLKVRELERRPDIDGMIASLEERDLSGIACRMENVLETVTVPAYPVIADIRQMMQEHGAMKSLMSGSGPTVFGIFSEISQAEAASAALQASGLSLQTALAHPVS